MNRLNEDCIILSGVSGTSSLTSSCFRNNIFYSYILHKRIHFILSCGHICWGFKAGGICCECADDGTMCEICELR